MGSALVGGEGLGVDGAEAEAEGTVRVWAVTEHPGAAACPECGTMSGAVHEYVLTRPRDLRRGVGQVALCGLERRGGGRGPDAAGEEGRRRAARGRPAGRGDGRAGAGAGGRRAP